VRSLTFVAFLAACGFHAQHAPADASPDGPRGGSDGSRAPEQDCLDGNDDNGDGLVDCADPTCADRVLCVPPAAGFTLGALVGDGIACPVGFDGATALHAGLSGGTPDCVGCDCDRGGICTVELSSYGGNSCPGAGYTKIATLIGDSFIANMLVNTGCTVFDIAQTIGNWHFGAPTFSPQCNPKGTAQRSTPTWTNSNNFCGVARVGGGCGPSGMCVARSSGGQCALADGARGCPAGYTVMPGPWYTGFSDGRSCGPCACGAPSGGDCSASQVRFNSGQACDASKFVATVPVSPSDACTNQSGTFGEAELQVLLHPPACAASSPVSGALVATDPRTLCCL
jgi:hypothetical protein